MPLLDIKGQEVQIGDKVLCALNKKVLVLGVFERVSKTSFIVRLTSYYKSAFSIPRYLYVDNPAYSSRTYWSNRAAGIPYTISGTLQIDNDQKNTSIFKVDRDFEL